MNTFRSLFALASIACAATLSVAQTNDAFHEGEWPFTPLARPQIPETKRDDWAKNAIDAFVLAELERKGLQPSRPADRETLLRRVTFDLTGLPPTIEEIEAFLADNSPGAYERVVDRLMNSPRFGERWARHWLDVVHYADTAGYKRDYLRPDAWRYRDYVIAAFNDDLPLNRFIAQQIAGDELEPDNPQALIATGMLRMYAEDATASDFMQLRQDMLDDLTETTGLAFLGLTMGCAKCHDHKFDPIQQADFFRMEACFAGMVPRDDRPATTQAAIDEYEKQYQVWAAATGDLRREIDELVDGCWDEAIDTVTVAYDSETKTAWHTPEEQRTIKQQQLVALSYWFVNRAMNRRVNRLEGERKERYDELQKKLAEFEGLKPPPLPRAMSVEEGEGPVPATHILATGNISKPEKEVSPGFPEFLGRSETEASPGQPGAAPSAGRRSAFARWLTLPDHPLTTRVMVNRLWQHHFGRGIVSTPNDFGAMGEPPSHPKLLDWLSSELVARNWSMKSIHKLMVTSATYQQTSLVDSATQANAMKIDPENKYLWKANRQRLDAEPLRDSLLFLSGRLNETIGGPSAMVPLAAAVFENSAYAWQPDAIESQHYRRSIYGLQKRNLRLPLLAAFDQPDMYMSCGERAPTLTAVQSLALFNGDDSLAAARRWAGRLLKSSHGSDADFITHAWLEAYGRKPTQDELELTIRFLQQQTERVYGSEPNVATSSLPEPCSACLQPVHAAAYVDVCHGLLNSSEFVFVD